MYLRKRRYREPLRDIASRTIKSGKYMNQSFKNRGVMKRTFRYYGCKGDIADAVKQAITTSTRRLQTLTWWDESWRNHTLALDFHRKGEKGYIGAVLLVLEDAPLEGLPSAKAREVLQASELRYKSYLEALQTSAGDWQEDNQELNEWASLIRARLHYGLRMRDKENVLRIVPSSRCKEVDTGCPGIIAVEVKEGCHVRWRVLCLLGASPDEEEWDYKCGNIRFSLREVNSNAR